MERELLGLFSQYGLPGVILALVGWMTYQLWRDLKNSWETRITDHRQLVQVIENTNTAYVALASSNEIRARAIEAVAQSQLAITHTLTSHMELLRRIEECQTTSLRHLENAHHMSERIKETTDHMAHRLDKVTRS